MVSFSSAVRRLSPVKARKAVLWCFVGGMSAILASSWVNQNIADISVSQAPAAPIQFDENLDHEAALSTHYPSTDPFFDSVKPSPFPFAQEIREISERFELSHSLIFAVAKTESGFRTQVESGAGAVGVMQVIAHAAGQDAWQRVLKKKGQPSLRDWKDPYTNMLLGS
ncbi:MAG: transglycosylase SLT domain-containing protein, partial [Pseudomonadales bacterium]|nr:transglycosylase SLT domain-containing protein [Pseudomonadales bacterium]